MVNEVSRVPESPIDSERPIGSELSTFRERGNALETPKVPESLKKEGSGRRSDAETPEGRRSADARTATESIRTRLFSTESDGEANPDERGMVAVAKASDKTRNDDPPIDSESNSV
jgi:hypothetical protein